MAYCESCGKPVYRLDRICANCGAPVTQNGQSIRNDIRSRDGLIDDYTPKSQYDILSSWGFVGSFFLLSLPIVGFIIMIVWASGGVNSLTRRNLARAYLIMIGLAVIFWIIFIVILGLNGTTVDQFYSNI